MAASQPATPSIAVHPQQTRCSERGCPFPVAPGQTLCQRHVDMFALDTSAIDEAQEIKFWGVQESQGIESDFREDGETIKKHVSIIGPMEAGLARWREGLEPGDDKKLFRRVKQHNRILAKRKSGLCVLCPNPSPVHWYCDKCRRKFQDRLNTIRRERLAKGICPRCGKHHVIPDKKVCEFCHDYALERGRRAEARLRKRRKALGICRDCSKPTQMGRTCCENCLARIRELRDPQRSAQKWRIRYIRLRLQGRCTKCAKTLAPERHGRALCRKCLRLKSRMKRARIKRLRILAVSMAANQEATMKAIRQRQYNVRINCPELHVRDNGVVIAGSRDTAWRTSLDSFFSKYPQAVERNLTVGGSVALAN